MKAMVRATVYVIHLLRKGRFYTKSNRWGTFKQARIYTQRKLAQTTINYHDLHAEIIEVEMAAKLYVSPEMPMTAQRSAEKPALSSASPPSATSNPGAEKPAPKAECHISLGPDGLALDFRGADQDMTAQPGAEKPALETGCHDDSGLDELARRFWKAREREVSPREIMTIEQAAERYALKPEWIEASKELAKRNAEKAALEGHCHDDDHWNDVPMVSQEFRGKRHEDSPVANPESWRPAWEQLIDDEGVVE